MKPFPKRYLGDGAYIECRGYELILTTESGYGTPTNTVVIDVGNMEALIQALIDAQVLPPKANLPRV
jgi:hypothetical protein